MSDHSIAPARTSIYVHIGAINPNLEDAINPNLEDAIKLFSWSFTG